MPDYSHLMGRIESPKEVDTFLSAKTYQFASQISQKIKGTGKGKRSHNFKIVKSVLGEFPIIVQETGDCVAFGLAGATQCFKAIRTAQGKGSYGGSVCTEDIYGGSRILIGKGQLGRQQGSVGIWAAEYAKTYGTLVRKKYGNVDLSVYDVNKAIRWGNSGIPQSLLPYAEEHQYKEYVAVRTWEEVCDLLYNGYMITVASNRGFGNGRDAVMRDNKGFLTGNQRWGHQMYICDYRDDVDAGVLVVNSWPKSWVTGPKGDEEIPDGTGWIRKETFMNDMISANDSFGFTDYEDFPLQDLDWDLIKLMNEKLKDF